MGLASCFSALEVVPLTLLTLDAWDFIKLRNATSGPPGAHDLAWSQKWAIYFLMAVGVWNFVGAGIFGFLINLPIVSYFEVGTSLTANHGHAAMFGVFGMLALAGLVLCLRAMQSDATWKETEKFIRVGFWGANAGLALMIILDLFPGGVIQLGLHRQRILARAPPDISDGWHLPQAGMAAHGGGYGLPLRRRPAHHARRVAQFVGKGPLSHAVKASPHRDSV